MVLKTKAFYGRNISCIGILDLSTPDKKISEAFYDVYSSYKTFEFLDPKFKLI